MPKVVATCKVAPVREALLIVHSSLSSFSPIIIIKPVSSTCLRKEVVLSVWVIRSTRSWLLRSDSLASRTQQLAKRSHSALSRAFLVASLGAKQCDRFPGVLARSQEYSNRSLCTDIAVPRTQTWRATPFNARSIFKSWVRSANLQPFVVIFSVATIGWIQR